MDDSMIHVIILGLSRLAQKIINTMSMFLYCQHYRDYHAALEVYIITCPILYVNNRIKLNKYFARYDTP